MDYNADDHNYFNDNENKLNLFNTIENNDKSIKDTIDKFLQQVEDNSAHYSKRNGASAKVIGYVKKQD